MLSEYSRKLYLNVFFRFSNTAFSVYIGWNFSIQMSTEKVPMELLFSSENYISKIFLAK